jgi:hypothetical protein
VVATARTEEVLAIMQYEHPENAHLRQVVGYWEMVASLVLRGLLHPAVYLDWCGEGIFTFACMQPHLEKIRETFPRYMSKTEEIVRDIPALRERADDLAVRMTAWREQRAAALAAAMGKQKRRKTKGKAKSKAKSKAKTTTKKTATRKTARKKKR